MRNVIAVLAVAIAAVVVCGASGGAPARTELIRPGVRIGKVGLGMTTVRVRRILGRSSIVSRREERGFGRRYVEYQWDLASWSVGFLGAPGHERAVRVGTTLASQRTPAGVGVGSTTRDLARAYGSHVTCVYRDRLVAEPGDWLVLRGPGARLTTFRLIKANGSGYQPHVRPAVGEVVVREAWPPGSIHRCAGDWRTWRW